MNNKSPHVPQPRFKPLSDPAIESMNECESDCVLKTSESTENRITFNFNRSKDNQLCLFNKTHDSNSSNEIYFNLLNGHCSIFYSCDNGKCGQKELKNFKFNTTILEEPECNLLEMDPSLLMLYLFDLKDKYNATFNFERDFHKYISKHCDVIYVD